MEQTQVETVEGLYALIVVERYESPYQGTSVTHFRADSLEAAQAYFADAVYSVVVGDPDDYDDPAEYAEARIGAQVDSEGFIYDGADWMVWAQPVTVEGPFGAEIGS